MKSKLFKLPKNRSFNFTPRYYNEKKEQLDLKRKEIARELNISEKQDEMNLRIKDNFKLSRPKNTSSSLWSNIRLLLIFTVLLLVFYYVYINLDDALINISNSNILKAK